MLAKVQRQVELGHLASLGHGFQLQARQLQGGTLGGLPVQGGLEQRRMAQAAQRVDDFHHLFERQVLVRLGVQYTRAHLL
ncbi:hypothetical protein D3C80_1427170 [compost metagenome]